MLLHAKNIVKVNEAFLVGKNNLIENSIKLLQNLMRTPSVEKKKLPDLVDKKKVVEASTERRKSDAGGEKKKVEAVVERKKTDSVEKKKPDAAEVRTNVKNSLAECLVKRFHDHKTEFSALTEDGIKQLADKVEEELFIYFGKVVVNSLKFTMNALFLLRLVW